MSDRAGEEGGARLVGLAVAHNSITFGASLAEGELGELFVGELLGVEER